MTEQNHADRALYTAQAHIVGGRAGSGRSADGELDVDLRRPTEMGGEGGGTNPEQLFAVGHAACFLGALGAVARRRRVSVEDAAIDSEVSLLRGPQRSYAIAVALHVSIPDLTEGDAPHELVREAHSVCAYSNATRGNVQLRLTVNGEPVREPSHVTSDPD